MKEPLFSLIKKSKVEDHEVVYDRIDIVQVIPDSHMKVKDLHDDMLEYQITHIYFCQTESGAKLLTGSFIEEILDGGNYDFELGK